MDMEFAGEKAMEAQNGSREASIRRGLYLEDRKEREAYLSGLLSDISRLVADGEEKRRRLEHENRRLRLELDGMSRSAAKWRRGSEEWAARLEKQIERAIGEILGPKCPRDAQCVSGRGCRECWREHLMLAAERELELEAELQARDQEKAETELQARNPEKAEAGCGIDGGDCGAREAGQ